MESVLYTDVDGGLLLRLLETSTLPDDLLVVDSNWKLTESSRTAYLENTREVYQDIEALKKAQAVAPFSRESLEPEIIRREGEISKWHVVLLKGLVCNQINEIECLKNGAQARQQELILEVQRKDEEIQSIQAAAQAREQELLLEVERKNGEIQSKNGEIQSIQAGAQELNQKMERKLTVVESLQRFVINCNEQLAEKSKLVGDFRREAATCGKQLTEKCKKIDDLEINVTRLTAILKDKDRLIELHQQNGQAECQRLRVEAEQQRKDFLESYLVESLKAVREGRLRIPTSREDVRTEKDADGGHPQENLQIKKKRLRDCARIVGRNVPDKLHVLGKRIRKKCQKYGMDD